MNGIRYRYDIPETTSVYRFGIYQLKRLKPVIDVLGNKSTVIGNEWDNTFSIQIINHAKLDLEINAFDPSGAFSYNDHTASTGEKKLIIHFAGRLTYSF